jgi:GT2 family glycosyltransferase
LILGFLKYVLRVLLPHGDARLELVEDKSSEHDLGAITPSVAIIIPTRDKVELLSKCVSSILEKTSYPNFKIVIVDNMSTELETAEYLAKIAEAGVAILKYRLPFNFSAICNLAVQFTTEEYVCFLNNDTEVIEPRWLSHLVDHQIGTDAGVVGSILKYPDGSIQHAGIALNHRGVAGHVPAAKLMSGASKELEGGVCHEVSAVTFACALISRGLFNLLGPMDEAFRVGLNDVDYCLRASEAGFKNIVCSRSFLIHHESATRIKPRSLMGLPRALSEVIRFLRKWPKITERFYK